MSGRPAVHAAHCCWKHGCKYGHDDCPVEDGKLAQKYPCETCSHEIDEDLHEMDALITPYLDRIKALESQVRALAGAAPTPRPDAPDYRAEAMADRAAQDIAVELDRAIQRGGHPDMRRAIPAVAEARRIRAANEALEAAPTAEPPK